MQQREINGSTKHEAGCLKGGKNGKLEKRYEL
jgi:hypothetical protein